MSGDDLFAAPESAPLDTYRDIVRPEWIDHNGHMNMGYYLVVFDLATDAWFRYLGLDEAYRQRHRATTFCLEAHVSYHREVREGDGCGSRRSCSATTPSACTTSTRCITRPMDTSPRPTS